jgi:hypothetical protein
LRALHDYLSRPRTAGLEGVRRERKLAYAGVLDPRAEAIYGILGGVTGIKGRRAVAQQIADTTPVSEFMRWTQTDFLAAGFSNHMANKLASHLHSMEVPIGGT